MPTMPAPAYPSKTARSSANAICRAASFTGCQSVSLAPRSTSSTCWRSTVNGTRSSTIGWDRRTWAMTPSAGAATACRCRVGFGDGAAGRLGRVFEEIGGRHEEQGAGHRGGEVQDPVVARLLISEEHPIQHPLGDRRGARVADEVGAELTAPDAA